MQYQDLTQPAQNFQQIEEEVKAVAATEEEEKKEEVVVIASDERGRDFATNED